MTIFKFVLVRSLKNRIFLAVNAAYPVALVLTRGFWEDGAATGFHLLAIALIFSAFFFGRGILNDKIDGTVTRILAAPVSSFSYFAQNLLAYMVPLSAQIAVVVAVGAILYGWGIAFALLLALCYAVFAMSSVAFSFAWSCLFKSKESNSSSFGVVVMIVLLISGLTLPAQMLPAPVRAVGMLFPAHWMASGIGALLESDPAPRYWLSLAAMSMFTVAYLLYGGKRRII